MAKIKLLGELVAMTAPRAGVPYSAVVDALRASGLDEGYASNLGMKTAFGRATKQLSDKRVIRKVNEDASEVQFQFTAEQRTTSGYEYSLETFLYLSKDTGTVRCVNAELRDKAQKLLDHYVGLRLPSDITITVHRVLTKEADLFQTKERAAFYFVPVQHQSLLEKVGGFLTKLGGALIRYEIYDGKNAKASVKDAVEAGVREMVEGFRESVKEFGESTREDTFARAADKVKGLRFKLQCYAAYLEEKKAYLDEMVDEGEKELRTAVEKLTRGNTASLVA